MEGQIDLKALTFFNNICRQDNSSLEKQASYRQLLHKNEGSASCLVAIRKILLKYDLPNALELLEIPHEKAVWKRQIYESVHSYWKTRVIEMDG